MAPVVVYETTSYFVCTIPEYVSIKFKEVLMIQKNAVAYSLVELFRFLFCDSNNSWPVLKEAMHPP
jgi:hypothetical protein